ncbi:hypothetical protein VitviT2T_018821 [Vitis vinifera]|uniref:Disease resistance protein n=1 Tax=Vitis vinifera TaxID=29760 RepID=A0ABY9CYL8_VITVI|nr:hypothetical protein VitviT2T_018821 [Vitis vinifera]
MEPSRSRTSPDTAAEDLSGSDSKQPVYSELDAKSDLGKKPSQWMQSPASISKIMHNVWQLSRKKDVVCLILSYPPFNSWNNERHRGWILDVLEIIHKVRTQYENNAANVLGFSSEITRLLHHSIHDIEAHVPTGISVKMCERWSPGHTAPKKAMLDLCIDDFMIRQFSQHIQIPEIRSILISEVNDKAFPCRLKNLPPIRQMFDPVIQVNVKSCLTKLYNLEELVIEDCPEINSIVTHEVLAEDVGPWVWYLPKLKKISLHYMPKLVSISSNGVGIGPRLECLSFYDCPSLKILSPEEVSSGELKVIIGEAGWWSALKWNKSEQFEQPNLDAIFVPIERDIDSRTQLAEIND